MASRSTNSTAQKQLAIKYFENSRILRKRTSITFMIHAGYTLICRRIIIDETDTVIVDNKYMKSV